MALSVTDEQRSDGRSRQQAPEIHLSLFQIGQAIPLDLLRSHAQNSR